LLRLVEGEVWMIRILCVTLMLSACAASRVRSHRITHERAGSIALGSNDAAVDTRAQPIAESEPLSRTPTGLSDLQHQALRDHPDVAAAYARWRASIERITVASRLPEPTLSYGAFLSAIETRTGPQRQRVGIAQALPWPSGIQGGIDAASERADAEARRFEATALDRMARVATAYWQLWEVDQLAELASVEAALVRARLEQVGARVETGDTSLSELHRAEIASERALDRVTTWVTRRPALVAALEAAVGGTPSNAWTLSSTPPHIEVPAVPVTDLTAQALHHPRVLDLEHRSVGSAAEARQRAAERLPGVGLFADWIDVGPARMDGVADSGKDAVMIGATLRVPIATKSWKAGVSAARADADAWRSAAAAERLSLQSEIHEANARVLDTARRAALLTEELIPRLIAARDSVSARQTADAGIVLIDAEIDVIRLQAEAVQIAAAHAIAWTDLERLVGAEVPTTPYRREAP
jgi:cobalt-zinc-cadmium efflux system outer membrane protein